MVLDAVVDDASALEPDTLFDWSVPGSGGAEVPVGAVEVPVGVVGVPVGSVAVPVGVVEVSAGVVDVSVGVVGVSVGVVDVSVGPVHAVLEPEVEVELGTVEPVTGGDVVVGTELADVGALGPGEAPPAVPDVGVTTVVDATAAVGDTVGVTVISVGGVTVVGAAGVGVGGSTVATVVVSTRPGARRAGADGGGVTDRVTLAGVVAWAWVGGVTEVFADVLAELLTELGADFEGLGGWLWLLDVGVEISLEIEIGFDTGNGAEVDAGRMLAIGCTSLTPLWPAIATPA